MTKTNTESCALGKSTALLTVRRTSSRRQRAPEGTSWVLFVVLLFVKPPWNQDCVPGPSQTKHLKALSGGGAFRGALHGKTKRFAKGVAMDWLGPGALRHGGILVPCPGWPFSPERTEGLRVVGLRPQGAASPRRGGTLVRLSMGRAGSSDTTTKQRKEQSVILTFPRVLECFRLGLLLECSMVTTTYFIVGAGTAAVS